MLATCRPIPPVLARQHLRDLHDQTHPPGAAAEAPRAGRPAAAAARRSTADEDQPADRRPGRTRPRGRDQTGVGEIPGRPAHSPGRHHGRRQAGQHRPGQAQRGRPRDGHRATDQQPADDGADAHAERTSRPPAAGTESGRTTAQASTPTITAAQPLAVVSPTGARPACWASRVREASPSMAKPTTAGRERADRPGQRRGPPGTRSEHEHPGHRHRGGHQQRRAEPGQGHDHRAGLGEHPADLRPAPPRPPRPAGGRSAAAAARPARRTAAGRSRWPR